MSTDLWVGLLLYGLKITKQPPAQRPESHRSGRNVAEVHKYEFLSGKTLLLRLWNSFGGRSCSSGDGYGKAWGCAIAIIDVERLPSRTPSW
jgi:hypothetical protein